MRKIQTLMFEVAREATRPIDAPRIDDGGSYD
jgi:hypothetical protein